MPNQKNPPSESELPEPDRTTNFSEQLNKVKIHFGRFLWDVLGVLLIVIALLTLLGLFGLTQGSLIGVWVELLKIELGWGSYLIVLMAAFLGYFAFRFSRHPFQVKWGKVISFEFAAFLSLAVLSIIGGNHLAIAEQGKWGGRIGWSIASIAEKTLGPTWGGAILFLTWGFAVLSTFGLWKFIEHWVNKQAGETQGSNQEPTPAKSGINSLNESPVVSALPGAHTMEKPVEKRVKTLPPEFRKNFRVTERQDKASIVPLVRGERLRH